MKLYVDVKRSNYLGNRSTIEAVHSQLGIEVRQDILYCEDVKDKPVAYRYHFDDPGHAALFKLTWV